MTLIIIILLICSLSTFSKDKNKGEKIEKKKFKTIEISVENKSDRMLKNLRMT